MIPIGSSSHLNPLAKAIPICDQVSDAILDACLRQDPRSKVACETVTKTGMIMVLGEISTNAILDIQRIVRDTVKGIGYDDSSKGFDFKTCNVLVAIERQSPDISQCLNLSADDNEEIAAGDQGTMFGYATDETPELMPLTLMLAHGLTRKLAELRKNNTIKWLLPDCKAQVTAQYRIKDGATIPERVHTVVLSTQHTENVDLRTMQETLLEEVVKTVIPKEFLDDNTIYHLQPSGKFVIGGPQA